MHRCRHGGPATSYMLTFYCAPNPSVVQGSTVLVLQKVFGRAVDLMVEKILHRLTGCQEAFLKSVTAFASPTLAWRFGAPGLLPDLYAYTWNKKT